MLSWHMFVLKGYSFWCTVCTSKVEIFSNFTTLSDKNMGVLLNSKVDQTNIQRRKY